jgi:hypothetical protein
LTYLEIQKSYGLDKLRWKEAEEAEEAEEKIRLKQYVSLRLKGRHNYSIVGLHCYHCINYSIVGLHCYHCINYSIVGLHCNHCINYSILGLHCNHY